MYENINWKLAGGKVWQIGSNFHQKNPPITEKF